MDEPATQMGARSTTSAADRSPPGRLTDARLASDSTPAIAEAEASDEIAEIYADIRRVLQVSSVNLIWRHLATLPGALLLIWRTLRPLYVGGTIASAAAALRGGLNLPKIPAFPPEALASAGLSERDLARIRDVLAAYDRTNAMALIALLAAQGWLDGASSGGGVSPIGRSTPPPGSQTALSMPPLLNLSEMSTATAELVLRLNRLGTRRRDPVLASMYRHLAHWPQYLALAWTLIAPLDEDGRLGHAIADGHGKAEAFAMPLLALLPAADAPVESEIRSAASAALERFTGDVIARMVVIGALLRDASGRL